MPPLMQCDQCEGGTQRAANYITEGYQAYLEATDPGDYLTFSRAGGILQGM